MSSLFFPISEGAEVRIRLLLASAVSCWHVWWSYYSSWESYRHISFQCGDHKWLKSLVETVALVQSYYWDKRCLFSPFHSCSLHTHAHTHPSFLFFHNCMFADTWSYPGVRAPGSFHINTAHAWAYRHKVHSHTDKVRLPVCWFIS